MNFERAFKSKIEQSKNPDQICKAFGSLFSTYFPDCDYVLATYNKKENHWIPLAVKGFPVETFIPLSHLHFEYPVARSIGSGVVIEGRTPVQHHIKVPFSGNNGELGLLVFDSSGKKIEQGQFEAVRKSLDFLATQITKQKIIFKNAA